MYEMGLSRSRYVSPRIKKKAASGECGTCFAYFAVEYIGAKVKL